MPSAGMWVGLQELKSSASWTLSTMPWFTQEENSCPSPILAQLASSTRTLHLHTCSLSYVWEAEGWPSRCPQSQPPAPMNMELTGQKGFEDVIKVMALRWEVFLGYPCGPNILTWVLKITESFPAVLKSCEDGSWVREMPHGCL